MEYKLQNTKIGNFWNLFFVLCTSTVVVVNEARNLCFASFLNLTFVVDVILQNTNFNSNFFATTSILQDGQKQGYASQAQVHEKTCRETQSSPVEGVAASPFCKCLCLNY